MSQSANVFSTPNNTVGNLNGLFKEVYADKLKELIPDGVKLLNMIPFVSKEKQGGNLYHQPVVLGLEHGITFASSDEDAFNLQSAIAGKIRDAQVRGNPLVLRSILGYAAASRAQGGKNAFMDATKYLVSNMLRSMAKKLEIEMLYGQMGYAAIDSAVGAVLTITTAEWAPGIWAGAEGMPIEIRDAAGAVTKGEYTVKSVDMDARTVTLTAVPVGVVATDIIWHKGAFGNEFAGIHKILTIASGQLFNINVAEFNLFRGNSFDALSGALSFTKLNQATARAVEKGLDGKLLALVNPRGWANMLNDQAALRKFDQSYKEEVAENGSRSLKFFSQNGEIEIHPSIYVKEGYAYLLAMDEWMRVGSTEMTFKRPGNNEEYVRDLENSAGYEMRLYTDQAAFCSAPGRNVVIINIVNSQ